MTHFAHRSPQILSLGFRPEALAVLGSYVELLWSANEDLNLFSRKMTLEELVDNHVLDCLLPLRLFPDDVRVVADFGSGGGLPGVLYALQFPGVAFRLYEKSPMKQKFLARCLALAPNIEVFGEIPRDLSGVDLVTARGFKPVDVILDMSRGFSGRYFLLKGRREKIEEELVLARKKFTREFLVEPLRSPVLDVERHLVSIKQI